MAATLALVLCVLAAGCDGDATGGDPPAPEPLPPNALFVPNQADATISVISTESNAVVRTLDLTAYEAPLVEALEDVLEDPPGDLSNAKPHHVVVEPDGSAFYVSLIGAGEGVVAKFDRRARLVGAVPFESPGMMALAPARGLLYVTHTMSIVDVPQTVAAIDYADMTLAGGNAVEVGIPRPHGVGVHPAGSYAYAGSLSENRLAAVDTRTQAVRVAGQADEDVQRYVHFALSPDGARLYAAGQTAGQVRIFDLSDPAAPALLESVDVGTEPFHPVLSRDGATLYVGNKGDDTVTALDTGTLGTETIGGAGLAQPHGSALSPGGEFLYVSNQNGGSPPAGENGTVVVIDTATREVVQVIEVGRKPAGLGVR